jgi:hypothetical protein
MNPEALLIRAPSDRKRAPRRRRVPSHRGVTDSEDIRAGVRAAHQRVEDRYGRDSLWKPIGPGHDEAWEYGYISGKLATLRWVLGSEWDFLDT